MTTSVPGRSGPPARCRGVAAWLLAVLCVGGFVPRATAAEDTGSKDKSTPETSAPKRDPAAASPGKSSAPVVANKPETAPGAQAPLGSSSPAAKVEPVAAAVSAEAYAVKLRDLESRVDELKEQIRRSHTRLSLLSDSILAGGGGGARAQVLFKNELSGAFRLVRALFILDGAVQYNKQDDGGGLAEQKEIPIFHGTIPPGDHTLQVALKLRGHGYGVFSYLRGYEFDVKESHSFTVTDGKMLELDVVAWEKGGVTTPLEERPALRHLERLKNVSGPIAPAGQAPAAGQSAAEK